MTRFRMPRARRTLLLAKVVVAGLVVAGVSACEGDAGSGTASEAKPGSGGSAGTSASGSPAAGNATPGDAGAGGSGSTLTLLATGQIGSLDPQRIATRDVAALASRTVMRTLTTYPPGADAAAQGRLTGDLATDTGRPSKGGSVWAFTLRDGLRWSDGTPLTCKDVAYGVSRAFDPDLSAGPGYPLAFLAVPRRPDGTSTFAGPDATGASARAGAAAYAKAVACDRADKTVTFTLTEPLADFNAMVSLPAFAPYRQGAKGIVSSGPYAVDGTWGTAGASLIPNTRWSPDSDPIRPKPLSRIVIRENVPLDGVARAVLTPATVGERSIAWDPAPPAMFTTLSTAPQVRTVTAATQVVDYLVPDHESAVMRQADIRRAFAMATDRTAYAAALGGAQAATPAVSLLGPGVPGTHTSDPLGAAPAGDPARAKALLAEAGVATPVAVKLAYRQGAPADAAVTAMLPRWAEAGFAVTLVPVTGDYFATVEKGVGADVYWGQWGADYPSAAAVLPPLFDSSINLGESTRGRDYGRYADSGTTARMALAGAESDPIKQAQAWRAIDSGLLRSGAYVGLADRMSTYYAGAGVGGPLVNSVLGGVIDLAAVEGG